MNRIKLKDTVQVLSGKNKGKTGEIIEIDSKANKVKVRGVAIVTRHKKPKRQGDQGGIVKEEGFIHVSNVMPVCSVTKKPCRVGYEKTESGAKIRVSRASGEPL